MEKYIDLQFSQVKVLCDDPGKWEFTLSSAAVCPGVEELKITLKAPEECDYPQFRVNFMLPQEDMISRWQANGFFDKNLPPIWWQPFSGELACGAPVVEVAGQNGNNRFCCAVSDALRKTVWSCGINEFEFAAETCIKFFTVPEAPASSYEVTLRFDLRDIPSDDVLRDAFAFFHSWFTPIPVPEAGVDAWYSTWYSYHKELKDTEIEAEAEMAVKLGMKGIIVDDGWQTDKHDGVYDYTGDWEVSPARIENMKAHVERIHAMGLKYMLWYSVPFIGVKSKNYSIFQGKYLYENSIMGAAVLDPRFPEVRQFLIDLYVDAVKNYGLDGLKLDFIDRLVIPDGSVDPAAAENYAGRDIKSLPVATDTMLKAIRKALTAVKPDILIEFRQKYMGPAIKQYGNLIRATDCPGDIVANRCRVADLRLSSTETLVHGDMLRWHFNETAAAAARQILAVLFAVPQISVRLGDLPEEQLAMLKHRLEFYNTYRETLVWGKLQVFHREQNAPLLRAEGKDENISALYTEGLLVSCPAAGSGKKEIVVNASCSDRVLVEVPAAAAARSFDLDGTPAETVDLVPGINVIRIPVSGECIIG